MVPDPLPVSRYADDRLTVKWLALTTNLLSEGGVMDDSVIADRLIRAATAHARSRKYRIGPGADSDIARFATEAVPELKTSSTATGVPIEALIKTGEHVFELLVDEMIFSKKNVRELLATEPNVIGERTLELALVRLCPIWPICRGSAK